MSKTTNKFSPEDRARAVRMVLDHEGGTLSLGCGVIDCGQDWLFGAYAAGLGQAG
jgi:hypothetical protein